MVMLAAGAVIMQVMAVLMGGAAVLVIMDMAMLMRGMAVLVIVAGGFQHERSRKADLIASASDASSSSD